MYFQNLLRHRPARRNRWRDTPPPCEVLEVRSFPSAAASSAVVDFRFDNRQMTSISVDGVNLLRSAYLIGSRSGADITSANYFSNRSSDGQHMASTVDANGPPFRFQFTRINATTVAFQADVGPVNGDFQTLSMPFDFVKDLIESFKFDGSRYRVELSDAQHNGTQRGNGAAYDSIPARGLIPETNGGRVSVAIVDGAVSWGEVTGPLATVRVDVNESRSRHYQSLRFHNHFGTDNLELSFGRMRNGESAHVDGQIIVTPKRSGPLVFQAETNLAHQIGRADGDGWSVNVRNDTPGRYLAYGPYTTAISNGQHTATFRLQLDNVRADDRRILTIDVFDADTGRVVSSHDITRREFRSASTYQDFNLNFTGAAGHRFEFRTLWHGHSYAKLDKVTVR